MLGRILLQFSRTAVSASLLLSSWAAGSTDLRPTSPSEVRLDYSLASVQTSIAIGKGSKRYTGEILKLINKDRFVGIFPSFKLALDELNPHELKGHALAQMVIPFDFPAGKMPTRIKVSTSFFLEKDDKSKVILSSYLGFGKFSAEVRNKAIANGVVASEIIQVESQLDLSQISALQKGDWCTSAQSGSLTISFAIDSDRAVGNSISIVPSAGPSLVVFVESQGNEGCP